jgi:6-phosphogluconolactonase
LGDVPELRWAVTAEPLGAAARLLAQALRRVGLGARLAVPGGSAARVLGPLRALLGAELWRSLRVTWVDERRVPHQSADSNRGTAHRAGWLGSCAPVALELPLWLDEEHADAAVERIRRALTADFADALDAVLLGMGPDGHIASLFPGHPVLKTLAPVARVDDSPKPPPERITLTLPVLATASVAVLVATGASKRNALEHLRAGDRSLPAARLGRLCVITDQAGV